MRRFTFTICLLLGLAAVGFAQAAKSKVDFEMMTWPEIKEAIRAGKTTVLVMNGGTEQRGPQNVNGGHTLMGRAVVKAVADKLGNAIIAPVLPFSAIDTNPDLPGTIGITVPTYVAINEEVTEQLIKDGFKNVVLMLDHGGAYRELAEMAKKLDAKYSSQGVRVVFCGDVYRKASDDIAKWLTDNGYPKDGHAGISDTSLMLYLGGDDGWVRRELVATALGDMPAPAGQKADPKIPRINNGITGDARRSNVAIGKRYFDMKVDYAVTQIHQSLATK
jgi:creatinine amidohydrolase/Fe(II)-dependent formamide hydrolase-like protein